MSGGKSEPSSWVLRVQLEQADARVAELAAELRLRDERLARLSEEVGRLRARAEGAERREAGIRAALAQRGMTVEDSSIWADSRPTTTPDEALSARLGVLEVD